MTQDTLLYCVLILNHNECTADGHTKTPWVFGVIPSFYTNIERQESAQPWDQ